MKKLLSFFSIMLFGVIFLSSCAKSDDPSPSPSNLKPTINFVAQSGYVSGDAIVYVSQEFMVNITAFANTTSSSKLVKFTVTRVFNNVPSVVLDTTMNLNALNIVVTATSQSVPGDEVWYYKVTDKDNQTSEVSLTLTTMVVAGPINTFSMKILGAQSSTTGSSFASFDGSVYNLAQAKLNQGNVDLMYYYGATDLSTLAAPDDDHAALIFTNSTNGLQTWTIKNNTRYKLVTDAVNWDAIEDDAVIVEQTASGVTLSRITNLAVGNYLAFITASGMKGMIKVESMTTGGDGSITISVKIQL
ncbi:MAG: hypothetical protein IH596_07255 [Bacteroidales bacterium]|nr:hypothetical protein [Bacteroidales bacterium]